MSILSKAEIKKYADTMILVCIFPEGKSPAFTDKI